MKYKGALVVLILFLGVIAGGCVSVEEHVKVTNEGGIALLEMSINMSKDLYYLALSNTSSGSFCGDFRKNLTKYEAQHFTCQETISGETATIKIIGKNIDPEKLTGDTKIKIKKEGDYMEFWDYTWYNESKKNEEEDETDKELDKELGSLFTIDYYLEMPGKIVDSNAQTVNGNKAEWHWNINVASEHPIYAKSKVEKKGICGPASILGLIFLPLLLRRR